MPGKKDIAADKMCRSLGGDFDYDNNTCSVPLKPDIVPKSILKRGMLGFFILQVGIGTATTILGIYFSVTLIPVNWWSSYILLGISIAISIGMTWYKIGDAREAAMRVIVSVVSIFVTALVIGMIYYWDAAKYLDFLVISGEPLAAAIIGIPISALLSIILVPPEDRKGDDASNDFGGGATLAILG